MANRFFVTGTDTGVGKTVVSALLCAALNAFYWKPIQTGTREGTDRATVMRLAQLSGDRTMPETYHFAPPLSPHLAAMRAGTRIELRKIQLPLIGARDRLIAEGAGGVLVPINKTQLMVDLMSHLGLPVLLVSRTSLGTINHTLLSLAALRSAKLDVRGVIMVGKKNRENLDAIERYGDTAVVGSLARFTTLNRNTLLKAFQKNFDQGVFAT